MENNEKNFWLISANSTGKFSQHVNPTSHHDEVPLYPQKENNFLSLRSTAQLVKNKTVISFTIKKKGTIMTTNLLSWQPL